MLDMIDPRPAALHRKIAAVCPIDGVSIGDWSDKKTWRISVYDAATDSQKAAAQAVIDAFDPSVTPSNTIVDGLVFLDRHTDDEYNSITVASRDNAQLRRWIDMLRLRGEIDVAGGPAVAAKAALVQAGLLTAERADIIFAGP